LLAGRGEQLWICVQDSPLLPSKDSPKSIQRQAVSRSQSKDDVLKEQKALVASSSSSSSSTADKDPLGF
jgi:hypothetical protein